MSQNAKLLSLGSCRQGFAYSSISRNCTKCSEYGAVGILVLAVGFIVIVVLYCSYHYCCLGFVSSLFVGVVGTLLQMSKSGLTKIVWSTYQIVESVPSTVIIKYPVSFQKFVDFLAIFSFSYLDVKCVYSNELASVWAWSIAPLLISFLIILGYGIRSLASSSPKYREAIKNDHMYCFLLLSFLVSSLITLLVTAEVTITFRLDCSICTI